MVLRPYQWFLALVLSAAIHGWALYHFPIFQHDAKEKPEQPLPFTVLLADEAVLEQFVLEEPESVEVEPVSSDLVPLVSLEDIDQPEVEVVSSEAGSEIAPEVGESLELPGEEMEPPAELEQQAEVAMKQAPNLATLPPTAVISLSQQESVDRPEPLQQPIAALPDLPVLKPEQIPDPETEEERVPEMTEILPEQAELSQEPQMVASQPLPEPEEVTEEIPEMPELGAEEIELPTEEPLELAVESVLPPQRPVAMPEVNNQSEVILAEITIEQVAFDSEEMENLPEVKAEDWKPAPPNATRVAGWKGRYSGAVGIGKPYRKKMRSTLVQFTLYPKAVAEELRVEGKVVVGFMIDRKGYLLETEILESSGHPALDQAVEKMVEFAQPFEHLPATVKSDKVRFAFPVTVKLKQ